MSADLLQLFPPAPRPVPLSGGYLAHHLHRRGSPGRPFVYANFVSSLDGRIAVGDADKGEDRVPESLMSASDWRLFQELQAQADCFITGAGYLRALAAGKFPDILQVGLKERDLLDWRLANGLPSQPAIVVPTGTLDIPLPESLEIHRQPVHVVVPGDADGAGIVALERRGATVHRVAHGRWVDGAALARLLAALGFRSVYAVAGPRMLATLLGAGALDRLYLTVVHRIVGGTVFDTLLRGPELGEAGRLRFGSLLYDSAGDGQWFAWFDALGRQGTPPG